MLQWPGNWRACTKLNTTQNNALPSRRHCMGRHSFVCPAGSKACMHMHAWTMTASAMYALHGSRTLTWQPRRRMHKHKSLRTRSNKDWRMGLLMKNWWPARVPRRTINIMENCVAPDEVVSWWRNKFLWDPSVCLDRDFFSFVTSWCLRSTQRANSNTGENKQTETNIMHTFS